MVDTFRYPKLLIGDYADYIDSKNFIQKVLKKEYTCIDDELPICRFRGTVVEKIDENRNRIVGWQRNIARIRKMDVSLPTIISMVVNKENIIEKVELDSSFVGSRGLFCSHKYIQKNMTGILEKFQIDDRFLRIIKIDNMHCFHLTEILGSMYAYYMKVKDEVFKCQELKAYFYDEEVTDSYIQDGNLISTGIHNIKDQGQLKYSIIMRDIFNKTTCQKNGFLKFTDKVDFELYINGKQILSEVLKPSTKDFSYTGLVKTVTKCLNAIKDSFYYGEKLKFLNSNIIPLAFVGMFVQSMAVRMFKNNYEYTMHMLSSIQRHEDIPLCIGSINNIEEAARYFPDFNMAEII